MSESPRRRFLDRFSEAPTLLGEGTRFEGNLTATGTVVVSGELTGNGQIVGSLLVGQQAHWQGDIRATNAAITGRVTGNVIVEEKLEIGQKAIIRGSVTARSLAIAKGAIVEGQITVTGSEPPVRFEEQRS
jgi:cytoskeletal protein CcmA (bactofilin family)